MNLSFAEYLKYAIQNPILLIIFALVVGFMGLNGGNDASNTVAICVGTRSLSPKKTIILAGICDSLGVFVMSFISSKVAQTMFSLADFGDNGYLSLTALTGGLIAVVIWMGMSNFLGIPSSSSHIIAASISGAAIAINGFESLNFNSWKFVLIGLVISTIAGFVIGNLVTKLVEFVCKNMNRRKTIPFFKITQIISAGASAFVNGAQDGQKAMGIFLLSVAFGTGVITSENFVIPIWLMIICSIATVIGIVISARKMIKSVGINMVRLEPYQGTCADISNVICSLFASIIGIPMSTTHTKMSSIMGVGASRNIKKVNWSAVKDMVLSWIVTFPGCMMLAYIVTFVLVKIYS